MSHRHRSFPRCRPLTLLSRVAVTIVLTALPRPGAAQQASELPAGFDEPMPLYESGLGTLTWKVRTDVPAAQAYYDQGVQLMYAFTPVDAARSFREAQKLDPSCVMCFWAEAWAWGPYLNEAMVDVDAPRAYAAIQKALALPASDPVERDLVEAMAIRYEPTHDQERREELDEAYSEAMAEVWARHPDNIDVGTLYGESLMLQVPRRGNWDLEDPAVQKIHEVLEELLGDDIGHPGACHLYVHATESTPNPGKAEACADLLGQAIPGASHINHMPSHTYNRVGRWGDAVRSNIEAWHSDLKAEYGEGFAIYPSHNLHMLLFAASNDGQGAIAIQAAKDYAKIVEGGSFYHALTLMRFGRFDEVLELEEEPSNAAQRGLWAFARGYAHLREGAADSARAYLEQVEKDRASDVSFRGHPAAQLLGVVGFILEGELQLDAGHADDAIALFETAVALEDELRYDEPEPLVFSARHWLGAALLENGRAAEAETVYRAELLDHPRNGWSLHGLAQALTAQGKTAEAADVRRQFEESWARSDTWIRSSRF